MIALNKKVNLKEIYDQDFNIWLENTVKLLKEKKFAELDVENLIEEIESMGKNNKRELESRLIVLIMHLLKWKYQPQKRTNSWLITINEQRIQMKTLLKYNPSLKSFITTIIEECYQDARKNASKETKLTLTTFPPDNPFSLDEILDSDFFPDSNLNY